MSWIRCGQAVLCWVGNRPGILFCWMRKAAPQAMEFTPGLRLAALVAAAKHADPNNTDLLDRLSAPILRYPQVIGSATMPHPVDLDTLAGLENMRANVLIVLGGTGRINIRFSGTEPNLLRVMIEGGPSATLQDAAAQARTICNFVGAAAGDPNPPVDLVDCMTGTPL